MTREEILNMEPKKIDWEIAKISGINEKLFRFSYELGNFNYSSDLAAAWGLIESLASNYYQIEVSVTNGTYTCDIWESDIRLIDSVEGDNAPEVISKAFLLAMKGSEEV